MISKILITLAVIMLCMWVISNRGGKQSQLREIANPQIEKRRRLMLISAIGFMVLMLIATASIIYFDIESESAVVTVHVVNTQSGKKTSYRTNRDKIQKDSFTTPEGRVIYIADVERIEIEKPR